VDKDQERNHTIVRLIGEIVELINEVDETKNPNLGVILIAKIPNDNPENAPKCIGFCGGSKQTLGRLMNEFLERSDGLVHAMITEKLITACMDENGHLDVKSFLKQCKNACRNTT